MNKIQVRRVCFEKEMKNKVRRFYNDFYDFIEAFIKHFESKSGNDSSHIERELREFSKTYDANKNLQKRKQIGQAN